MKRDNSIVGKYYKLPPKKRLDQIYYHYNQFEELVNNYEYEIAEWIKANKQHISLLRDMKFLFQK